MKLNQIFIFILLGFFFTCCSDSILAPLYPIEALKKGVEEDMVGFIFASHPAVAFISSLFIGKNMSQNGRKIMIIIGIIMQSIGLIGFGLVIYINDKTMFIICSVLSRILQGVGKAYYSLPCCALIPILYKEEFEVKITYIEAIQGVGLFCGYIFGSALYAIGGYTFPFFFNAGLLLTLVIFMQKVIPSNQEINEFLVIENNQLQLNEEANENQIVQQQEVEITYTHTFKQMNIIMSTIANVFPSLMLLYLEPTFAIYLNEQLSIGEDESGLFFSIACFIYFIFTPIIGQFIKKLNKKFLIFLGLMGFCISYIIMGPDPLTGLKPQVWIVIVSLICLGLSASLIYPPMLPEIVDNLNQIYPQGNKEIISDIGSTIYNSTFSLGEFLGPFLSGIFAQTFSFPRSCSLMGLICGIFGILYMLQIGIHKITLFKKNKNKSQNNIDIDDDTNKKIIINNINNSILDKDTNDEL